MVRRALAMAAGEQYVRLIVGFLLVAAISRLLTPGEVGVAVIGTGVMTVALALREFATSEFLIQRREIGREDIRTAFTVVCALTAMISAAVFALAPLIASWYGEPRLALFLRILAVAGLIEATAAPITGLLRRDMAFGSLAAINTCGATVNALVAVGLAWSGHGYMSIAWASMAAATTVALMSYRCRPYWWILRPSLRSWRATVAFGGYNGATALVSRGYEALPQLVLGRFLTPAAAGIYNRASLMSGIPDKVVLTSVFSVAFPALAAEARAGRDLKQPYLHALGLITVLYWPAQSLLALLAYPAVLILLGDQWTEVAPLLRILSLAALAWFPVILTTPMLLAVGANRERLVAEVAGRGTAALALCAMAYFGVMAMALSQLVLLPFQMLVALYFVRRHVPFTAREVVASVLPSAVVTACSLAGPFGVFAASGFTAEIPVSGALVACASAVPGWLIGVWLVRHPIMGELERVIGMIASAGGAQRLFPARGPFA